MNKIVFRIRAMIRTFFFIPVLSLNACFVQVDTTVLLQPEDEESLLIELGMSVWSLFDEDSPFRKGRPKEAGSMPLTLHPEVPSRVEVKDLFTEVHTYENGLTRTGQRVILEMEPGTEIDTAKILSLNSDIKSETGDLLQFPSFRFGRGRFEVIFPANNQTSEQAGFNAMMMRSVFAGAVSLRFLVAEGYPVRTAKLIHLNSDRTSIAEDLPVATIPGGKMVQIPSVLLGIAYESGSILVIGFDETKIDAERYQGILDSLSPSPVLSPAPNDFQKRETI